MGISLRQAVTVGAYVLKQRFKGVKRYPLVLMLEPLFRCNLECAGCGKIQYPEEILKKNLSPEECFRAAEECGAPVVTIAGGEPLIHPKIDEIAKGLVERKKFVYLCTNAILLERHMHKFTPSPYFTFSIHLDGMKKRHDELVCREGVFDVAVRAIKAAKAAGFRVTTNTTVFDGENPEEMHEMFDFLADLGVDGMTISPGYSYAWAPDQEHFLRREQTHALFRQVLSPMRTERGKRWQFNQSSFFLDFLMGERDYECTPWGNPNYNVFGWQKPCYLLNEGYAKTFGELLEKTKWEEYGRKSGNPKCQDCMVHCGYEPTAVIDATANLKNMLISAKSLR
ncbi:MAG TPA: adenosyl-hopene transferase HpnH [Acidobacteriota bacterium]|nr:adenosyl-hopene transferase HpnH [Acidobacteriota bacterium]HNB70900.1 adenosyl-hopene transferase HpnH [Acidobacteriota bacterium]HNH84300.1 adenosyl-hopene transferase HpnH [Acidobacteriota bacterium]HNJ40863.1 adenosyl-hopene transferase HpnH [Acidobacteriota bacterium]